MQFQENPLVEALNKHRCQKKSHFWSVYISEMVQDRSVVYGSLRKSKKP